MFSVRNNRLHGFLQNMQWISSFCLDVMYFLTHARQHVSSHWQRIGNLVVLFIFSEQIWHSVFILFVGFVWILWLDKKSDQFFPCFL